MKKLAWLTLMLLGSCTMLMAQPDSDDDDNVPEVLDKNGDPKKVGIIYNTEFAIGGGVHTNGFNLSFQYGWLKKYYLTKIFYADFGMLKHPKEYRQSYDYVPQWSQNSPKPFVYGKQNSFYVIRVGYGEKRYFSDKAKKRGIAIGASYSAGVSLGLLKPYYLDIVYPGSSPNSYDIRSEPYSTENASYFLNLDRIYGASGAGLGWGGIKPIPGGYARAGLLFDWGAFDSFLKDIEVGGMIDVYYKRVPIMLTEQNYPFFANLYINIHFGKRS